jgi:hypothetical protein
MHRRFFTWLAALAALTLPPTILAADPPPTVEPTLVVQLKSLEGMLADAKYLLQVTNRADQGEQLDGALAAWQQGAGLNETGIDFKRPILAYAIAKPDPQDSIFAVLVPIEKQETVMKALESLAVPIAKQDDDCYSLEIPGRPVALYFRFANSHMYLTAMNKANIDPKNLVEPHKLKPIDPNTFMGVSLRIDQIPESMKKLILGQMELRLAEVKERQEPGESPQQARMRRQGIDAMGLVTKTILDEGKSLQFNFAIDRAKDDINLSLAMDGKPGTATSTIIAAMSGGPSNFAPAQDAAFHVGFNFALPLLLRPLVNGVIDMGVQDIVARETDETKKQQNTKLLNAVTPTLKKGVIDLHLVAGAKTPGGKFNLLAAMGVENGPAIESAIKELVRNLPANEQNLIQLDAKKTGDISVHRLKVEDIDAPAQRIFGDNAHLWAGFSKSAMLVGIGANAEDVVQTVTKSDKAVAAPLIVIEGSLRPLAALDADKTAAEVAADVFGKAPTGSDRFRLSLDGGQQLKLNLSLKGTSIKFASQLQEKRGR